MGAVTIEELTQLFLDVRGFDPWDLVADFLGILVLGGVGFLFSKRCGD